METSSLNIDSEFWIETEKNTALLNPGLPDAGRLRVALEAAADAAQLTGHVIFATSGTTGNPKFACLSRRALLASARAVNAHLMAAAEDHWFCPLPLFHVGGIGIIARAELLRGAVTRMENRWEPMAFCAQIDACGATLTALVPTQVHDIVVQQCGCPSALRGVLVGGGALPPDLRVRAVDLGWPLLETFGMTEAGSQIATQPLASRHEHRQPGLEVLPIWSVHHSVDDILEIRGAALFSGYLQMQSTGQTGLAFVRPFSRDGWFRTSDRVKLLPHPAGGRLHPVSRLDQSVKVLGENVNIAVVQAAVDTHVSQVVIAAVPHPRSGNQLVAVVEAETLTALEKIENSLRRYNRVAPPPERINRLQIVRIIPRTELGKVANHQLISALSTRDNFRIIN